VPNLWGALGGRPGVLKSAAVAEALRLLQPLIATVAKQYEQDLQDVDTLRAALELQIAGMKKSAARANGLAIADNELAGLQAELRELKAVERRYMTQDTTVEKLGELLQQNPRGMLLKRDELTGPLRSWQKPGREGEREFYLEA